MEDDFCLMVKYFWTLWVPNPLVDSMKGLTLKLKALKVRVKDWARIRSAEMNCEFREVDSEIHSLLASNSSGLLSMEDLESLL